MEQTLFAAPRALLYSDLQALREAEITAFSAAVAASNTPLQDAAAMARAAVRGGRSDLVAIMVQKVALLDRPGLLRQFKLRLAQFLAQKRLFRDAALLRLDVLGDPRNAPWTDLAELAETLARAGAVFAAYDLLDGRPDLRANAEARALRLKLAREADDLFEVARLLRDAPNADGSIMAEAELERFVAQAEACRHDTSWSDLPPRTSMALAQDILRSGNCRSREFRVSLTHIAGAGRLPDALPPLMDAHATAPGDPDINLLRSHLEAASGNIPPRLLAPFDTTRPADLPVPPVIGKTFPGSGLAVCISGQFRGFERSFPSLKAQLIDPHEPDIFVSTWPDPGTSVSRTGSLDRALPAALTNVLPQTVMAPDTFAAVFPALAAALDDTPELTRNSLIERFGFNEVDLPDEAETEAKITQILDRTRATISRGDELPEWDMRRAMNSMKMFFHIWNCDRLVRQAEDRRGAPYRLVLRLRPDKRLIRFPLDRILLGLADDADAILVNDLFREDLGVGDQVAVARSEAMARYAALWPKVAEAGTVFAVPGWRVGFAETLMHDHFKDMRLKARVVDLPVDGRWLNGKSSLTLLRAYLVDLSGQTRPDLPHSVLEAAAMELTRDLLAEEPSLAEKTKIELCDGFTALGFVEVARLLCV